MNLSVRPLTSRRWINPYIARIGELAPWIVGSEHASLRPEEVERFHKAIATASQVFVELGSGSGGHLLAQAMRHPTALWIGIELRFKRIVRTAEKARAQGLHNVCVVRSDAREIAALITPQQVDGIFVNFPDPWDKRRWKKHRLLDGTNFETTTSILKPGGTLALKTDHRGYFEEMVRVVQSSKQMTIKDVCFDLHHSEHKTSNIATEFERLFLSQGLPIHLMTAVRSPLPKQRSLRVPRTLLLILHIFPTFQWAKL